MHVGNLIGSILKDVIVSKGEDIFDYIEFHTKHGPVYRMFHAQDCCEDVHIESIVGDIKDLIGSPILLAEQRTKADKARPEEIMYTFYTFATVKGYVDIRWYGESEYYSVEVSFVELTGHEYD